MSYHFQSYLISPELASSELLEKTAQLQMLNIDYYEILQVIPSSEQAVIEAAYKGLARRYHPDLNKSVGATKRMQDINLAYECLADPAKRANYDRGRQKKYRDDSQADERAKGQADEAERRRRTEEASRRKQAGELKSLIGRVKMVTLSIAFVVLLIIASNLWDSGTQPVGRLPIPTEIPATTHFNNGRVDAGRGDIRRAIVAFREAIRINPDSLFYFDKIFEIAHDVYLKRDFRGALALYRLCAHLNPDSDSTQYSIAYILERTDPQGAIEAYREAIRINPKHVLSYNNWGLLLRDRGDLDGAVHIFREAIRINADYADAYFNMGLSLYMLGDLSEAVIAYREVIRTTPDDSLAHFRVGLLLEEMGHKGLGGSTIIFSGNAFLDDAYKAYREVIRIHPNDVMLKRHLEEYHLEKRRFDYSNPVSENDRNRHWWPIPSLDGRRSQLLFSVDMPF